MNLHEQIKSNQAKKLAMVDMAERAYDRLEKIEALVDAGLRASQAAEARRQQSEWAWRSQAVQAQALVPSSLIFTPARGEAWRIERVALNTDVNGPVYFYVGDSTGANYNSFAEVCYPSTAGFYSDAFVNTLYIPENSLLYVLTGVNTNLTVNLQVQRLFTDRRSLNQSELLHLDPTQDEIEDERSEDWPSVDDAPLAEMGLTHTGEDVRPDPTRHFPEVKDAEALLMSPEEI